MMMTPKAKDPESSKQEAQKKPPCVVLTVEEITDPGRLALTGRQTVVLELLLAHAIRETPKQEWTRGRQGEVYVSEQDVATLLKCNVSRVYEHVRGLVEHGFCKRVGDKVYVRKLPSVPNVHFEAEAKAVPDRDGNQQVSEAESGTDCGENHHEPRRKAARAEAETSTPRGGNHHSGLDADAPDDPQSGLGAQSQFPSVSFQRESERSHPSSSTPPTAGMEDGRYQVDSPSNNDGTDCNDNDNDNGNGESRGTAGRDDDRVSDDITSDPRVQYLRTEVGVVSEAALAVVRDHPEWTLSAVTAEVRRLAGPGCRSVPAVIASALTKGQFSPRVTTPVPDPHAAPEPSHRPRRDLVAEMSEERGRGVPHMLQRYGVPLVAAYARTAYRDRDDLDKVERSVTRVIDEALDRGDLEFVRFVARSSQGGSPYPEDFPLRDWRTRLADRWRASKCHVQPWWRDDDHDAAVLTEYGDLKAAPSDRDEEA